MLVRHRRIRAGATNYRKRLRLLKSRKPRLVVRKSNKNILAQIVSYEPDGDNVIISAHSRELIKLGWKCSRRNIPSSYLIGLLIAKKALKAGIKEAVLDTGLHQSVKGSLIYSVLKGSVDAGLKVQHSGSIFPSQERIEGQHIAKNEKTKFTKFDNKTITENFKQVKEKISNG